MTPQVFSDMDGVLADFDGGYRDFSGIKIRGFMKIDHSMWKELQREWPTFWVDLDYESHALDLWRVISRYNPSLLTAIPDGWPSAGVGKTLWAKQNLPKFGYHPAQRVYAVKRSEKKNFAKQSDGTPNILIDDMEKNIAEWESAGGIGIHYIPSPAMIKQVERTLEKYVN